MEHDGIDLGLNDSDDEFMHEGSDGGKESAQDTDDTSSASESESTSSPSSSSSEWGSDLEQEVMSNPKVKRALKAMLSKSRSSANTRSNEGVQVNCAGLSKT